MAFVSRSSRHTTLLRETATLPRVGPGAYNIPRIFEGGHDRVAFVPFGCGSGRLNNDHSNDVPDPGSYIEPLQLRQPEPASWNAFKSSTPRFPQTVDSEDAQRPIGIDHTLWTSSRSARGLKRPTPLQKTVPAPVIPSIPATSFGYVMASDGTLQPRPPPEVKQPPGETGPFSTRGTVFGRSADRWCDKTESKFPGPGYYNPIDPDKMMFDKGKFSRLSSSFVAQTHREESANSTGPGPGQYEIGKRVDKPTVPSKFQNFGSRTERWVERYDPDDVGVGPGSYNPDRRPQYIRLRPPPVPFNSLSERFSDPVRDTSPGPQDYDLPSSIRKLPPNHKAPFGSQRERFETPRPAKSPDPQPLATTGNRTRSPRKAKPVRRVPAWKTLEHRQVSRPAVASSGPAPGSYEIDRATTAFQPRRYKAKGFQFAPRTRLPVRRSQITTPLITEVKQKEAPVHPAQATRKSVCFGTSSFLSHVDRFAGDPRLAAPNTNPGPGEYGDLRPTLLKKTFNVTIDPDFDRIPTDESGPPQ